MIKRTQNNSNPHRIPNVAKYNAVAKQYNTWERMVASTNFAAPNGCWEWTKSLNETGYGVFAAHTYGGVLAHRLAMHIAGKPVPVDMTGDHLCLNKRCVNPAHMEIVTSAVNVLRGGTAGGKNARKTHCAHGHEFTEENIYWGKSRTKIGTPTRNCRTCQRNYRLKIKLAKG